MLQVVHCGKAHFFTSFLSRDDAYRVLMRRWRECRSDPLAHAITTSTGTIITVPCIPYVPCLTLCPCAPMRGLCGPTSNFSRLYCPTDSSVHDGQSSNQSSPKLQAVSCVSGPPSDDLDLDEGSSDSMDAGGPAARREPPPTALRALTDAGG